MTTTTVHYTPAQNPTVKAQADIKAGTFVQIAANTDGRNPVVKPGTAGSVAFGVPAQDTAKDRHVMVYRAGHIVDVTASGAIAAGDLVAVGANGSAVKAADSAAVAGQAVSAAANNVVTVALI